jgi:hypothetical protein
LSVRFSSGVSLKAGKKTLELEYVWNSFRNAFAPTCGKSGKRSQRGQFYKLVK